MYRSSAFQTPASEAGEPFAAARSGTAYPVGTPAFPAYGTYLAYLLRALEHPLGGPLLLLALSFAIRCAWFGDPIVQGDEQFYLLVGDRMLHHGALPYVDVWDRKPIGLFLIYAAIRLLGGSGIIQYQVVATLFAWGAALVVARIARSIASPRAAWLAGALYLLWLNFLTGEGGQSPVFYNLFMAAAGLLTLRATARDATPRRTFGFGCAAMALCGVAMQIKYAALFEGVFFGLALLWAHWRRDRQIAPTIGAALCWLAIALLPSAAALGYYERIGQGGAFIYANVFSVMQRGNATVPELLRRLGIIIALISPLLAALALSGIARPRQQRDAEAHRFVLLWLGAAVGGFLVFGTYYDHYTLPLLVSLCAAAAPAFDHVHNDRKVGRNLAVALLTIGAIGAGVAYHRVIARKGDTAYLASVVQAIDVNLHGGCLYVYDGESILYHLTGACTVTKFLFPLHLNEGIEASGIGVDSAREVRRILAARPRVIVDNALLPQFRTPARVRKRRNFVNGLTRAMMDMALAHDYRLAARIPLFRYEREVWVRLPGR